MEVAKIDDGHQWAELSEGDYIEPEAIEKALDLPRTDARYSLGVLALKTRIMDYYESRENHLVLKAEHNGLRVLTHSEAADYVLKRQSQGRNTMEYWHLKARVAIDPSRLSDERRERYEARMHRLARILLYAKREDLNGDEL
jgi:hypothetical protein